MPIQLGYDHHNDCCGACGDLYNFKAGHICPSDARANVPGYDFAVSFERYRASRKDPNVQRYGGKIVTVYIIGFEHKPETYRYVCGYGVTHADRKRNALERYREGKGANRSPGA